MPSIMTVAKEAQVAVSTVSLALNHRDRVKPETRQRIDDVIQRLGYRPRVKRRQTGHNPQSAMRSAFIYTQDAFRLPGDNGQGTAVASSASHGLEIHVADDDGMSGYCRDVISGMQEAIAGTLCSLSVFRGADHVDRDVMINELIHAREFDGVVVFGADPRNGYLDRIEQSGLPLVAINQPSDYGRFSCVTLDYYGGGFNAIDYLASLGHRRIAVGKNGNRKWLSEQIAAGIDRAFAKRGLQSAIEWEVPIQEPVESLCRRMLQAGATALFTGDSAAVRIANMMHTMGVRVPEEFSILGFDDRGMVISSGLKLTSVGYDKRRMGRMAVRMLQQLHQSRDKLCWQVSAVSTYLTIGQTSAKAPAEGSVHEVEPGRLLNL